MGKMWNAYRIVPEKLLRKCQPKRCRTRWKENIKIGLQSQCCVDGVRLEEIQEHIKRWALILTIRCQRRTTLKAQRDAEKTKPQLKS